MSEFPSQKNRSTLKLRGELSLDIVRSLQTYGPTPIWQHSLSFAITSDFDLITFDKGFVQYKGLRHTILS